MEIKNILKRIEVIENAIGPDRVLVVFQKETDAPDFARSFNTGELIDLKKIDKRKTKIIVFVTYVKEGRVE